jgi:hypothetical protein
MKKQGRSNRAPRSNGHVAPALVATPATDWSIQRILASSSTTATPLSFAARNWPVLK